MSLVDDALRSADTARSGKSGSKSANKSIAATGQNGAFESAFANAGKKKQSTMLAASGLAKISDTQTSSMSAHAARDRNLLSGVAAGKSDKAVDSDTLKNGMENITEQVLQESVEASAAVADVLEATEGRADIIGEPASEALDALEAHSASLPAEQDEAGTSAELSRAQAGIRAEIKAGMGYSTSDKASLKDTTIAAHGEKAVVASHKAANAKGTTGDVPVDPHRHAAKVENSADDAAISSGGITGADSGALTRIVTGDGTPSSPASGSPDVNQLLGLLSASNAGTTGTDLPVEAGSLMQEFQALAERAGTAADGPVQDGSRPPDNSEAPQPHETSPEADRLFRFARNDGTGGAVSMSISADGEKASVRSDAANGNVSSKMETINVLESRRYLGLATANAATVTNAIVASPAFSAASTFQSASTLMNQGVPSSAGKVLNTLKIQMHPIELGVVTATLRLKDDELHVELKVETGEAFRQLNDDQGAMVKALRAQGFAVDQVNVVFNSGDSNAQQQSSPQGGAPGGDNASRQENGQRNDNGGQRGSNGGTWGSNDGMGDTVAALDPAGSDDVYI